MKHNFFYFALSLLALLFLCSTSFMKAPKDISNTHINDMNLVADEMANTVNVTVLDSGYSPRPEDGNITTRDRVVSVKGYDTCEPERQGNLQMSIKTALFANLHPFKIYVVYKYVVTKKVRIYSTYEIFKPKPSPACGLTVVGNYSANEWYQGYQYVSKNIPGTNSKETTMTTWIFKVICENDGTNIGDDVWIPCKKEDLTWVYEEWATVGR